MKHLADLLRQLDRIIDGEANDLPVSAREMLETKLRAAACRLVTLPPPDPENIVRLPGDWKRATVGNTATRTQFTGGKR